MVREVERRFLVAGDGWRAAVAASSAIRQFYMLVTPERSLRVRVKDGDGATLTLKIGASGPVREEFEHAIPLAEAAAMERFAFGNVVEKTRSLVPHAGHVYEVDVFAGALAGLVIAELETAEAVPDAALAPWLGREITGEAAFQNAALALEGLPEPAA